MSDQNTQKESVVQKRKHLSFRWLLLGLFIWLIQQLLSGNPQWVENSYSNGVFQAIRWLQNHTFGLLPFSAMYVLIPVLVGILIFRAYRIWTYPMRWPGRLIHLLFGAAATAAGIFAFFQLLWGFNYMRQPLEKILELEVEQLTKEQLYEELRLVTGELVFAREAISDDTLALNPSIDFAALKSTITTELTGFLHAHNLAANSSVPSRRLLPKGILLRISTAGFYFPYTGECNVDAGLHPLQLPFVTAHEYGHGYGFGPEDACNFIAYVTCSRSEDLFVRYTGLLGYWKYLAGAARRSSPEQYAEFWKTLSPAIKNDLAAIRKEMRKYPDILPDARDAAYNTYLKSQGVKDGMQNYGRVVTLAYAWRRKR